MILWVHKQVLGLDVSVAVAQRVDVGKCAECLVSVEFDKEGRDGLLHFVVVLEDPVYGLGDVLHHHVQIDFVLLRKFLLVRHLES